MKKILAIVMILAVVAAIAAPLSALAASGGTTEIDASVAPAIELTAPSPITLSNMAIGTNNGFSATNGVVKCNNVGGYNVTVISNRTDGKMVSFTDTKTLGAALLVSNHWVFIRGSSG